MTNFNMAVQHGIQMANQATDNGTIVLGLIGSGLNKSEAKAVFRKISKKVGVKLVSIEPNSAIVMTRV